MWTKKSWRRTESMSPRSRYAFVVLLCCKTSPEVTTSASFVSNDRHDHTPEHPDASKKMLCKKDMLHIKGNYCLQLQHTCLRWVDALGNTIARPDDTTQGRCAEFSKSSRCVSSEVQKDFCMDEFEYPNRRGERPKSWMTYVDVEAACRSIGKRLCTKSEWTFACEGPDRHPYPYGDGYKRDRNACNFDVRPPRGIDVMRATSPDVVESRLLNDLLVPSGAKEDCVSPFGVHDMVGNIDEWVINESGNPYASGLVGGHIFGVRNACRPMTTSHNENFAWYETGGRCCSEIEQ